MDAPFDISFRHFEPTERINAKIGELIGQLGKLEHAIINGRVAIEGAQQHGHKKVVNIVVELHYPGGTAIGKRSGEFPSPAGQRTFDTALTEAFRVAASQIKTGFEKLRPQENGQIGRQPQLGHIQRLDPTLKNGFVEMPDGESLFFSEAVLKGEFDRLEIGDEVMTTLAEVESPYGPQASMVKPLGPLA